MEALYEQFIRERQYLLNVSPRTADGYRRAWKAFEPTLKGKASITRAGDAPWNGRLRLGPSARTSVVRSSMKSDSRTARPRLCRPPCWTKAGTSARRAPRIASLEQEGESRERRDQLVHPAYRKPELLATAPNLLWSWDITKLRGPVKWTCFSLCGLRACPHFSRNWPRWPG